ncbi:hypothetical protein [Falsibacillus pallidus]|uniref:hypothetical protein n=1 Tax=Falsibacillus pallidus TaxID=493781 RepID=UPI003D98231B
MHSSIDDFVKISKAIEQTYELLISSNANKSALDQLSQAELELKNAFSYSISEQKSAF